MNTPKRASPTIMSVPHDDEFPASLVEIAITHNIPIIALRNQEVSNQPRAVLFIGEDYMPQGLEAIHQILTKLSQSES